MLITTVCPFCEQRWRVDDSLRGRQLRCPGASCRQVFEVREEGPSPEAPIEGVPVAPAPSASGNHKTGQVGELVPVVSAEAVQPAAPPSPPPPDWRTAPPPQRVGGAVPEPEPAPRADTPPPPSRRAERRTPPPKNRRKPAAEQPSRRAAPPDEKPRESADGPVELPPGAWDAPPVRGGSGALATRGRSRTALEMDAAEKRAQAKKHRAKVAMLAITGTVLMCLLIAGGIVMLYLQTREARDREAAEKLYQEGQFDQASNAFGKLQEKYPDSQSLDDYKFWQRLSEIRGLPTHANPKGAFDTISQFLKDYKGDPRLDEHGKEVGVVLVHLLKSASDAVVANNGRDPEAREELTRGRQVLDELVAINGGWVTKEEVAEIDRNIDKGRQLAQIEDERLKFLKKVGALADQPPRDGLRQLTALVRAEELAGSGFDKEPAVKQIEEQLRQKHLASLQFIQGTVELPPRPAAEDPDQSLVVQPVLVTGGVGPPLAPDRVIFALASGVLYGLRQDTGEIVWAMRVGIDTHNLPLRVPRQGNAPELALVLSSDTLTLTAVDAASGATLWRHRLGAANLGRPVIVDRRAFVPTLAGEVEEIELSGGGLLGRYKLGQPLSAGGARFDDKSKLVFFPGDDSCVYVLNVDPAVRRCEAVLYTDHEAGTLRGEPILLPSEEDPSVPGYLVLCQAHGLDATLLRTFQIMQPIPGAEQGAPEARLRVEPVKMPDRRLRGQPWFPPFRDPEKLITVTDAGVLGLFGINQTRNQDTPLFPLVRLPNQEEGTVELPGQGTARGRAQVVFGRGDDLWVLARGRLLRYLRSLNGQGGPQVGPDPRWAQPLDLGSPLHESQLDDAETTLFLVTQSLTGPGCLATAVDTETGQVRWQRQLGLVCQGDPRPLGEQVVALDRGGGLFGFRPGKRAEEADWQWQSAGHMLAAPLPDGGAGAVYQVAGPDGQSVFQFVSPDAAAGNLVIVRELRPGGGQASEYTIPDLPARLAGTPAVGANRAVLPLANGDTAQVRLPLGKTSPAMGGPDWRLKDRAFASQAHVVWLGGDDFLVTNGRRGLTRWRFSPDNTYDRVPRDKDLTLELPQELAGAPLVLSRGGEGQALRVCVADRHGTVHLFEGDELKPARRWALDGPLTAGPFARGGLAGCVVGRRTLVWLDPAKDEPLWKYDSPGEGIIGQPQLADGMVVVADVTGRFVGLDPATGRPRGPGYQLRASVGPAAAPAAFGAGRAFAPLTDGTVLLLSLQHLREPLPGWPDVW